jgi:hypothetical protein
MLRVVNSQTSLLMSWALSSAGTKPVPAEADHNSSVDKVRTLGRSCQFAHAKEKLPVIVVSLKVLVVLSLVMMMPIWLSMAPLLLVHELSQRILFDQETTMTNSLRAMK